MTGGGNFVHLLKNYSSTSQGKKIFIFSKYICPVFWIFKFCFSRNHAPIFNIFTTVPRGQWRTTLLTNIINEDVSERALSRVFLQRKKSAENFLLMNIIWMQRRNQSITSIVDSVLFPTYTIYMHGDIKLLYSANEKKTQIFNIFTSF